MHNKQKTIQSLVPGDCAAGNRGADYAAIICDIPVLIKCKNPMKKNKIFIDNFYEQNVTLGLNGGKLSSPYNVITGFHGRKDNAVVKRNVISEIFKALLLHDKIVFPTTKILNLIESFGIKDTISLLNTNKFELVDDHGSTLILEEKSENNYSLSGFQTSHETARETRQAKNSIDLIELRLDGSGIEHSELTDKLLLNVEKFNVV